MVFYHAELIVHFLFSPKSDYALFLGFSDLVSVGGMLPSVPQTPPPLMQLYSLCFEILSQMPRASPSLKPSVLLFEFLQKRNFRKFAQLCILINIEIMILKIFFSYYSYQEEPENQNYSGVPSLVDTICATRVFCSALLLPTIATFVGRLMYESVPSKVQRTLLVSDRKNSSTME